MNNKLALESLVMDLKRVALGSYRGSTLMAKRFLQESVKRVNEINPSVEQPYLQKILRKIENLQDEDAENALLYSILIQNYTQKFLR